MGSVPAEVPSRFTTRLALFLARFCLSGWIGAAVLFVIVSVTEVTRGGFDAATKDVLVAVRFPAFYFCGFLLITVSWLGAAFARTSRSLTMSSRFTVLLLLTVAIGLMVADYVLIYQPLLQLVTPPGQSKPTSFASYHDASKWINLAGLAVCLIAAVLLNWPGHDEAANGATSN